MQDNQFSQAILRFKSGNSAIKIQEVNGLSVSESPPILERKSSHVFPVMLLISGAKLSNLYLSYNGRAYSSINSLTTYDAKTATTKAGFVIDDFMHPIESIFSVGSYSNGLFTTESSITIEVR